VEENIYEVMKGHIQRQKEEAEARNAARRQQVGPMQEGAQGHRPARRPRRQRPRWRK